MLKYVTTQMTFSYDDTVCTTEDISATIIQNVADYCDADVTAIEIFED